MKIIKSSGVSFVVAMALLMIVTGPLLVILFRLLRPLFGCDFSAYAMLTDRRIVMLFAGSLFLALCVVVVTLLVAFPLAYLISRYHFRAKGFVMLLILIPFFIPPYLSAVSWLYALGGEGWLGGFLQSYLHWHVSAFSITGFWGTLFVLSFWLYPLMVLFMYHALQIGKPYLDAARLYRNGWPRVRLITVLLAKYGILTGAALIFVLAFTNFSVPGALQYNVFPTEIFAQFGAFYDEQQAAVLSLPNLVIAILISFWIIRYFGRQKRFALTGNKSGLKSLTGAGARGVAVLLFLFFFVVLGFPLISLIHRTGSLPLFIRSFTSTFPQWVNSFLFAMAGAVITTGAALFMVLYSRHRPKTAKVLMAVTLLPLLLSGGLYGIGMIELWNQPFFGGSVYGTPLMVILSYFRFLPVAYLIISVSLVRVPVQYEEAGLLSGRSQQAVFFRIIFPMIRTGVYGALLLTFIFSFSELDTAVLIYPPGMETIPVRIFSLLHYGAHQSVAALSLWQIIVIVVSVPFFLGIFGKKSE
jgi:iron(III) transport system permease protein